jgi:hypothetical protein
MTGGAANHQDAAPPACTGAAQGMGRRGRATKNRRVALSYM